jgi:hypothetical protein
MILEDKLTVSTEKIDPTAVKAGDTVTLEADGGRKVTAPVSEHTLPGKTQGTWFLDVHTDGEPVSFSKHHWTLTDHQPAPEPVIDPAKVEVPK